MDTMLITVNSKSELKQLTELVQKMGVASKIISEEEKEDFVIHALIEEARKTPFVSREKVMKALD